MFPEQRSSAARHRVETLERRCHLTITWGAAPDLIGIDQLQEAYPALLGQGQTIAVIDTGIDYTHPALGGGFGPGMKVVGGYDFVDSDADPLDTNGHGTAVAGIIAADQFEMNDFTYRGIAPDAKLVALRIAPDTAAIPLNRIESALQWVIDNDATYHITAINLSFGFGTFTSDYSHPVLSDELQTIANMGIAFCASAGNAGVSDGQGISYPAADANAFSVGSVNSSDIISEFTQRSANLDLLAPGEGVRSTALGGGFASFSGTSFASPALTGTIALMRQIDPDFALADVQSMLRASSPTNVDGDAETGVTTGLTFQRLDVFSTVSLALQRKSATQSQTSQIGMNGSENDLAYDAQGVLHFAWYDSTARTAKYATRSAKGHWSAAIDIDDARPDVGTELSLKLDSYGRPTIAYLDGPQGDLKVAQLEDGIFHLETVDASGVTGLYPSLVIDSADRMFISYFRKTNRDLKLASFANGLWSRRTIDNDGDVGWSCTTALDNDGRPAIAYGDAGRNDLKIARERSDGSWTTAIVDGDTQGAAYLSLAFAASGAANISYYEVQTADLKFAAGLSSGGYRIDRVAKKGATGLYTNLDLDDNGVPSIVYWDRRTNALNRATRTGLGRYAITRLAANAGRYAVLNRAGFDDRLHYATKAGERLVLSEI